MQLKLVRRVITVTLNPCSRHWELLADFLILAITYPAECTYGFIYYELAGNGRGLSMNAPSSLVWIF